jgi:hypothetical protein
MQYLCTIFVVLLREENVRNAPLSPLQSALKPLGVPPSLAVAGKLPALPRVSLLFDCLPVLLNCF